MKPRPREKGGTMEHVKEMLQRRRRYMAERRMLEVCLDDLHGAMVSAKEARLKELDKSLAFIDGWLLLLSEDEAFVVRRHLIDGIDWPRVTLEYEKIWGESFAKTERTLRSYQKNALGKIDQFLTEHRDFLY
jgi:hypothetical protein